MNRTDIILASSHCHHVPQVGLPQTDPVARQIAVQTAPSGAMDFAAMSATSWRQMNQTKLITAMPI